MAISDTIKVIRTFQEGDKVIEVEMTLHDALLFKILQDLVAAIRKVK